ncbi:phosphoribosylformylglycinamidine synthase subunit PurL [Amphiplicatus metriothermophilus]|uniref:Phosphoribosylformylglycinamidine synthase subunit PurL n=1 Tax=Amphiplicatus metriothermophilus TaxID=1519374 RepID=A0A239PY08_9PROT|nr:phosphoribosylformylglycinamidine synthase subunit PurL [Amphiplicatus metriothermophilus]MBB5519945.1 phosphoribosylformylglycinamidine synthase [Amphiplicatus metriothermophilus]SNT74846.1 phosphoribosylformylglycinamidine synthase [Amphiplicatus metriothermophilus]
MTAITPEIVAEHGLSQEEYDRIRAALGREPNLLELGVFSVMWSEHCSYKSSRRHLKKLPTAAPWVIQGPGENAGVIDIGEGLAAVFKMESHNHPSYIEPYQGAATGVGGIMRDVFTMGARPVANMNALRFGSWDHPKTRHLVAGVVAGIGGYGNCMGVPTVGGETNFHSGYDNNILVNAMTVGIAEKHRIFYSAARGAGNPVVYVGSKTGRDGIHGATMASAEFGEGSEERRPTVQVGDPFTEKLLLEACLELMASDAIIAIQDMGAAGLTSSSVEMAAKGGGGVELDLDKVPQREEGMNAYEMMLSESQERMLMVLKPGKEEEARAIFEKWGLAFAVIGVTTDSGRLVVKHKGVVEADIPLGPLADEAPNYDRPVAPLEKPAPLEDPTVTVREALAILSAPGKSEDEMRALAEALVDDRVASLAGVEAAGYSLARGEAKIYARLAPGVAGDFAPLKDAAENLRETGVIAAAEIETHEESVDLADRAGAHSLLTALGLLMSSPDLCSRRWIWEQYDHTVMADTVIGPGGDAALVRVHGTNRALAITTDVTPRYVKADPFEGGKQAVAETWRNICATGAAPLAITNCLNFGNPERPEIMAQFVGAVEGMAEACEALGYPVVSGNVSLYNETNGVAIAPTPAIGGVGVLEDATKAARVGGAEAGDELVAVGVTRGWLGQSLYMRELFGREDGAPPPVDLAAERRNGEAVRKLIAEGLATACHDVSDGGLLVAAAEMALASGEGLELKTPVKARRAAFWFGEDQGRYLLACAPGATDTALLKLAMAGVQASRIGRFGGAFIRLDEDDAIGLFDLADLHEKPLPAYMRSETAKENEPMPMPAEKIRELILEALPDATVEIEDLAGDGDHYRARVVSAAFRGKNRVQQHQLVYRALKGRMGGELHALALETEAAE